MQGEIEHATPDFPEGTVGTTVPITEIRNIPSYRGTSLYHGTSLYLRYLLRYGTVGRTSKYCGRSRSCLQAAGDPAGIKLTKVLREKRGR